MGILQAGILEWVTISFSRASSQSRDGTWVSHIAGRFFTIWATREDPWGRRTTAIHRNKSGKTGEKKWDSHLLFTVFKQAKWHLPTWRIFFHRHVTGGYQRHQTWLEVRKSGLKVKQESSQFWEFSEEVVQQTSFCRDRSTLGCPCPPWKTHCPHETLPQAPGENATSHLNVTWSYQSDKCPGLVSLKPMRVQDRYPPRVLKCPHNYHTQQVIPHTEEGRIDARQSPQKCHAIS